MQKYPTLKMIDDRDEWIIERCRGQRVLHVGCTDAPQTRRKAKRGALLHQILTPVASSLVGIDIAEHELRFLRTEYGMDSVRFGDAENLQRDLRGEEFDVILAADVVEHLNNVGLFLNSAREHLAASGNGMLLVTVPAAFSVKKIGSLLLRHNEHNHPDHVAYYSTMCLGQLAERHRFQILESVSFLWKNPTTKNRVVNLFAKGAIRLLQNPYLADEIGCVLEPASNADP